MRQKEGIYMTHFYIIRHGETVFNRKGRIQGWCDSPLTDLGVSQAKQLGKELKNVPFDVCFCSTSERAIDTANSILEGRNVKIIPSKNLKEQSFGDFEAEKSVDIFKDGVRFVDEKPNTAALVPNCSVTRMDCDTELKLIEKPHLFHGQQTLK